LLGELRTIKPPILNEEKVGEKVESWLLGVKKYLQLHNYSDNLEARITIYHLQGEDSLWWEQLKQVKHIDERNISFGKFQKYFEPKYLSQHFYDQQMKEFFELKLGSMTMSEYEKKFLELLWYVDFIRDEKAKIQRFLSDLPVYYKDKIQYDEPRTLEESIRKAHCLYNNNKGRMNIHESWKGKVKDNQDQRKKG